MSTSDECCGWLGWAELAGIAPDGSQVHDGAATERASSSVATTSRNLPFITAVLRRAFHSRDDVTR